MEDREKQIEEIETIIKSNLAEGSFASAFAKKVAIQIVEYYQSKFSDSVVLSKEDKAKLVHIDTLKNIKSISQLRELLSNITAINDLMGYNDRELEIRQEERRETAEEFESELKAFIKMWKMAEDDAMSIPFYRALFEKIGELAKQSGAEIEG